VWVDGGGIEPAPKQTIVKRDVVFTVMPPSGHSVLAALRSSATESATATASRLGNCHGH